MSSWWLDRKVVFEGDFKKYICSGDIPKNILKTCVSWIVCMIFYNKHASTTISTDIHVDWTPKGILLLPVNVHNDHVVFINQCAFL